MISLSVVIPAYNEEARLPGTLRGLQRYISSPQVCGQILEVIVVNDGSVDNTEAVIRDFQKEWELLKGITLDRNEGKGAAVHVGLKCAASTWVLIADADMSTPWEELSKLVPRCCDHALIMGSRGLPQSQIEIRQHWVRQSMGRTFNRILRSAIGLSFKDTQCGFKLILNDDFFRSAIVPQLEVKRFAWDVEVILFLLKFGKCVREVPIRWQHQEQSRVRLIQDSLEMLVAVLKIKKRVQKKLEKSLSTRQ